MKILQNIEQLLSAEQLLSVHSKEAHQVALYILCS